MNKLIFREDSRDKQFYQRFGSVLDFPDEISFDSDFLDETQPLGDVKCVAYTTCDIAEDQQKIEFDTSSINDLWARVPSTPQGSDPRDVLGEAVKNGLLPKGATERIKKWRSYWRADLGSSDKFDNVRSTMMVIKQPVGVGTYWYREWQGEILPVGKTPGFGHMYDVEGWKQIDGQPHMIVQAWTGSKLYMPREVFNEALKPYGMQTWVLSTAELDGKRVKNLTEKIRDLCINLIIVLRNMVKEKGVEPVMPKPVEKPTFSLRENLLLEAEKWLGKDASPLDNAPEDLSCAESVSYIIRQVLPDFPRVTGTYTLWEVLKKDKRFRDTLDIRPGCVIISPTGKGNGQIIGHTGIVGRKFIMSSNSPHGTWSENYTLDGWVQRYRKIGGFPIYIFEPVDVDS